MYLRIHHTRILLAFLALVLALPGTGSAQLSKGQFLQSDGDGKGDFERRPFTEGFGVAVAISGRLAFVGESRGSLDPGTVTVFHRDSTTEVWSKEVTLTAPGGSIGTRFGELIDADSHRVLIGAPDDFGRQGAAYVFARQSPGAWVNEGMLQSNVPTSGRWYAETSLSISGDRAIVGEALAGGTNNGLAHIYKYDTGSWVADATLPTVVQRDRHGFGAAISGDRAVVGAYRWNPNPETQRVGIVYVYEHGGGTWTRTHTLNIPDSLAFDHFGYAVDIDGERIVAGNISTNGVRPSGYRIFDYDAGSTSWILRDSVANQGYLAFGLDSATVISGIDGLNLVTVNSGTTANGSWSLEDTLVGTGVSTGDSFGHDVAVSGNYAVVGAPGSFVGVNNAHIFERQPDSTWLQVAGFVGTGSPASTTGATVPCSSGMADIFACKDIDLEAYLNKSSLLVTGNMSDIWGWTDPVTGHEYALVTHGGGTTFVDVTDPVNPVVVGILPLHIGTYNSSWRDVKTYGDYAFVVADNAGPQGIQIFDLKELRLAQGLPEAASKTRQVATLPVTFSETAHYDTFTSAHNIAINDSSATAFIVGGRTNSGTLCGGGIHIVDISTPTAPDSTGCYADATTGRSSTGYTHDIQCVKYHGPDTNYSGREICFGANETAILISDVTDNSSPVTVGKGEYPDYGYVHQGWLTDDHRYFVLDDELDEYGGLEPLTRTLFWDVSDLTDPVLAHEYTGSSPAIDHNQYVVGKYLYQAQYTSGLRIVDISGITEAAVSKNAVVIPVEVAFFDTHPAQDGTSFAGAWSVYPYFASGNVVVSSIGEGMFVLKPQFVETKVDITVFLEGPYVAGADSMATSPSFQAVVPTGNPYQDTVFSGSALELNIPDSVVTLPGTTLDWVQVELRTGTEKSTAVMVRSGILLNDGLIVDPNSNMLSFPGISPGGFYIVVRHRNHLGVMSAAAVDLSSGSGSWDFTTASAQAFGANPMKEMSDGKWAMFAGEADLNGLSSAGDFNAWLVGTKAVATGYLLPDFDMDGQVTASDFNIWLVNTKSAATSQVPE